MFQAIQSELGHQSFHYLRTQLDTLLIMNNFDEFLLPIRNNFTSDERKKTLQNMFYRKNYASSVQSIVSYLNDCYIQNKKWIFSTSLSKHITSVSKEEKEHLYYAFLFYLFTTQTSYAAYTLFHQNVLADNFSSAQKIFNVLTNKV